MPPSPHPNPLPLTARWAIDAACEQFESRLCQGDEPRIEDYLAGHAEPARSLLFAELLRMEREYHRRGDEQQYAERFPEYAALLAPNVAPSVLTTPVAPVNQDEPGLPAIPGYEIGEELGRGGMGVVYQARQVKLNRVVALKTMLAGSWATPEACQRFRFEAEAMAALDHPHIVPIHEVAEQETLPYFAMKLVKGGSLASRLRDGLRLDARESALLMRRVAEAVHHAHQRGILHRDLKPGNILLDESGMPHVSDFGLARRLTGDMRLTQSGIPVGTLPYMAPEQARGDSEITVHADIYALGAILYELLTGVSPNQGETYAEVLEFLFGDRTPIPPRTHCRDVPLDLETICLKCLEKDPASRYPSAGALADDLDRFLRGEPVTVHPPGFWDWLVQAMRTRPQPSPEYTWSAPVWYGAISSAQHAAVALVVWTVQPLWTLWAVLTLGWLGLAGMIWVLALRRFRVIPITDRHTAVIAIGHVVAHIVLTIVVFLPAASTSCRDVLPLYPPFTIISGLCMFIIGSTNWGRLLPIGLLMMGLAPVMAVWPDCGPLLFALTIPIWPLWWGLATRRYFVPDRKPLST